MVGGQGVGEWVFEIRQSESFNKLEPQSRTEFHRVAQSFTESRLDLLNPLRPVMCVKTRRTTEGHGARRGHESQVG